MNGKRGFISSLVAELNRRKVPKTVGAYAVSVFIVLQLMDAAVEPLRLPDWLPTLVVLVLILGFPLVFLLAWQLDLTTDGIKRTSSASLLSRSQSALLFSLMLFGTGALGYGFYSYYAGVFENTQIEQVAEQRSFNAPQNSIAVLPFADLSELGDKAYLSGGIAEEILNLLSQVDGLHVAARTSSFAFEDRQKDIREIGRLLNVSTILEGSVRTAGNRIRMTAQLINVADGYHIWSETFDRELDDLFAIQDEVASSIAASLLDSFEGLSGKPAARTDSFAAFEAYRTGRLHWWRRSPEELQRAIELFAEALQHDAQFAPAYAALADSWLLLSQYGNITMQDAIRRAQPLIEKALVLDAESAEAFASLGLARWQLGQLDSAESSLRQAIRLNEDYIPARLWLGGLLGEAGRFPEQSLVLEEAMRLDPLNELLAINYAGNLFTRGDMTAGRDVIGQLLQVKPDSTSLLRTSAQLAQASGLLAEGWRDASRAYELEPDSPMVVSAMSDAWMDLGGTDEAEQVLLAGLETSGENMKLRMSYFLVLLVQRRYEEAEFFLRESFGESLDELPEQVARVAHFQRGMLALVRGENERALREIESAIPEDGTDVSVEGMQLWMLTMASLAHQRTGNEDMAERRLQEAERSVRRAQLNGVDNSEIHYVRGGIHAIRGETEQALEALQAAYDRGFRRVWVMQIDGRFDHIRNDPVYTELESRMSDDVGRARAEVDSMMVAMW